MRWCLPSLCVFRMLLCSPAQHRNKSLLKVPIPVRKEDSLLVAQHIPGLIQMAPVPQWTLAKAHSCNKIPTALLGVTEKKITTALPVCTRGITDRKGRVCIVRGCTVFIFLRSQSQQQQGFSIPAAVIKYSGTSVTQVQSKDSCCSLYRLPLLFKRTSALSLSGLGIQERKYTKLQFTCRKQVRARLPKGQMREQKIWDQNRFLDSLLSTSTFSTLAV